MERKLRGCLMKVRIIIGIIIFEVKLKKRVCGWRESNPRPLVHKTSALPIELQELRYVPTTYTVNQLPVIAANFSSVLDIRT